ncbi:hypothetical protein [Marinimicrobium agarilyticum]|uniref:hypothetical protein n=1 Tax=Marinimicrobium agarilyticum TaxID=306546 RepID=UPI000489B366|nr:hypothetical protein [Marinimicrobium agarilyticum]
MNDTYKRSRKFLLIFFVLGLSVPASSDDDRDTSRLSIGVGYGALFGGLGFNIAQVDENNYRYLSLGVISAYRSDYDGQKDSDIAYGVGIGLIRTDIILPDSGNHGLGLYAGAVGADTRWEDAPRRKESLVTRYGGGATYHYFAAGPKSQGLVVGISLLFSPASDENESNVLATLGYRF